MDAVSQALARRTTRSSLPRGFLVASLTLHLLLVLAAVFGPDLFQRERPTVRYVEVLAIPSADIAPGPRPEPQPAAQPEEPPEPAPREPDPEPPKPAPEDVPVLPAEEPPPEPPEPTPEPDEPAPREETTQTRNDPAPSTDPPASTGTSREAEFAGFDDPEFSLRYSYYLDRLIASIRRQWRRPNVGEGIELIISFRIVREGNQLTELRVDRSSGSRAFDRAGFEAVENAAPLPPLPQAYRKDSLGVRIIFR